MYLYRRHYLIENQIYGTFIADVLFLDIRSSAIRLAKFISRLGIKHLQILFYSNKKISEGNMQIGFIYFANTFYIDACEGQSLCVLFHDTCALMVLALPKCTVGG